MDSERGERAVKKRADGAGAATEEFGDLGLGQAVLDTEHHHGSLPGVEPSQSLERTDPEQGFVARS